MNEQDIEKAIEIAQCHKCQYEGHLCASCRDMKIMKEMAAWKEQQMLEKAVEYINNTIGQGGWLNSCQIDNFIEGFKKAMEN